MIPGYSNVIRLPRLGKIRLGEKVENANGRLYPRALDHFNFKDAPAVEAVYGANCKEIDIMFPCEDEARFNDQRLRAYTKSNGLFCACDDGETAKRVRLGLSPGGEFTRVPKGQAFDPQGEAFLAEQQKRTGEAVDVGEMFEIPCAFHECPIFDNGMCKPTARILFLLPKVPGFGCWEIVTTSWHGMVNINSYVAAIRAAAGRVSMIPIKLKLQPQAVQDDQGKKKTVHVLVPVFEGSLPQLLDYARRLPKALPAPALPPEDPNSAPDDLMPHAGADLDEHLGIGKPPPEKPTGDPAAAARERLGAQQPPQQPEAQPEPDFGDGQEPYEPEVTPPARPAPKMAQTALPVTPTPPAVRKRPWG